jgi:hypothetical protein
MNKYLTEREVGLLLQDFSRNDWFRATRYARMVCADLPDLTGNDLLNEAIVQLLDGTRRCPRNIAPLTSIYFAMRSIASHVRKRMKDGPIDRAIEVISDYDDFDDEDDIENSVIPISLATPEKIVQDRELITEVERLFDNDDEAKKLLFIWSEGVQGYEAALELGVGGKGFEAAKKRLRRMLAAHRNLRSTL